MNVIETMKAAEYLRRHGYEVREATDRVVVKDPVRVSSGNGAQRTEHQEVTLRSGAQVAKFLSDRS